jgi:hypothetical protein
VFYLLKTFIKGSMIASVGSIIHLDASTLLPRYINEILQVYIRDTSVLTVGGVGRAVGVCVGGVGRRVE